MQANERVASNQIVVFAQRFLELPQGKEEISDEEHEDLNRSKFIPTHC